MHALSKMTPVFTGRVDEPCQRPCWQKSLLCNAFHQHGACTWVTAGPSVNVVNRLHTATAVHNVRLTCVLKRWSRRTECTAADDLRALSVELRKQRRTPTSEDASTLR